MRIICCYYRSTISCTRQRILSCSQSRRTNALQRNRTINFLCVCLSLLFVDSIVVGFWILCRFFHFSVVKSNAYPDIDYYNYLSLLMQVRNLSSRVVFNFLNVSNVGTSHRKLISKSTMLGKYPTKIEFLSSF